MTSACKIPPYSLTFTPPMVSSLLFQEKLSTSEKATVKTLFQSLDSGDTWRDVTANFPFQLNRAEPQNQLLRKLPHFREIVFLGSTVYVSTNDGVAMSSDGENWRMLTDSRYAPIDMRQLAIHDTTLYGVSRTSAYRLNKDTGIWVQIASEVPGRVTSLAVARNTLYIGTEHRGILHLPLHNL